MSALPGPRAPAWTAIAGRRPDGAHGIELQADEGAAPVTTGSTTVGDREIEYLIDGAIDPDAAAAAVAGDLGPLNRHRGSFALVAIDRRSGEIVLARDHVGRSPLFYAGRDDGQVACSVSLDAAATAATGRARPSHDALLGHFAHSWPDPEATYSDRVRRVIAGCAVRIDAGGPRSSRYWSPGEPADRPPTVDPERFVALAREAVRRAIAGTAPAIFLSGGLDSVGVAALATEPGSGVAKPPLALSVGFPGTVADESAVQAAVADRLGFEQILRPLEELAGEAGPLEASLALGPSLEAPMQNIFLPAFLELARIAADRGRRRVLTGTGGDEWLGISPILAADLIGSGRLVAAVRLWLSIANSNPIPRAEAARRVLWTFGLREVLAGSARSMLRRAAPDRAHRISEARVLAALPPWVGATPEVRREMARISIAGTLAEAPQRGETRYLAEGRKPLYHPISSMELEEANWLGRAAGVEIHAPLTDPDVVALLAAIEPADLIPGGLSKGPLRSYVASRLPGLGFELQKKPLPTQYMASVIAREGTAVYRRLGGAEECAARGLIDPDRLEAFVRTVESSSDPGRPVFNLWDVLSLEVWLRGRP